MATPVLMPQMGESIAEGTIVRWIKKVGDVVDRDEPLFEISTDKVDAEIPSPAAGVLTEITVREGETVAVNSVVGTIGVAAAGPRPQPPAPPQPQPQPDGTPAAQQTAPHPPAPAAATSVAPAPAPPAPPASQDDLRRQRSSPLVRRIAREHNVDITQLHGSGVGGRVTKHDILDYLQGAGDRGKGGDVTPVRAPQPAHAPSAGDEVKPLSVMRRKIAEHMIMSRRTSAHVHTVFHVNFSVIERLRQQKKAEYEGRGVKLTYMAFIAKAVIDALRAFPVVNASLDGTNVIYKKSINLGIAVALETGLIVPVVKHADEKNLLGLSRAIADLAERARTKQLSPDDVHDGTFTITNPGQFGSQFGLPIINQPQVAILGVGTIEKRAVVEHDALAIRTMAYLTLGFDHRLIDGAVADQFMAAITHQLEHFDPNQV